MITNQRFNTGPVQRVAPIFQATPADAAFFIAPFDLTIKQVQVIHGTAGTDAGAVTLDLERLQASEAVGSGDSLLLPALNMKAAANTVQNAFLTGTAVINLSKGDRLALNYTGTLTALANVAVTVVYEAAA